MVHPAVRNRALPAPLHRREAARALERALRGKRARDAGRRLRLGEQRLHVRALHLQVRDVAEAPLQVDGQVAGGRAARHPAPDRGERHGLLRHRQGRVDSPQEKQVREVDGPDGGFSGPPRDASLELEGAPEVGTLHRQEPGLRVVGHDHRGILHGEMLQHDPQGCHRGRGRPPRAGTRGAAKPLVVEAAPRVHGEREPGTLESQPLHLDAACEQGAEAVSQYERFRGEEVPGKGGGVRDGDALQADAGEKGDVHLLHADVGAGSGGGLGEERLLEGGRVELPDEMHAVAGGGHDHHQNQDQSDQERSPQCPSLTGPLYGGDAYHAPRDGRPRPPLQWRFGGSHEAALPSPSFPPSPSVSRPARSRRRPSAPPT